MGSPPIALRAVTLATFIFLLAPLVLVIVASFDASPSFDIASGDFSLHWYRSFFSSAAYLRAMFANSLPIALIAATAATAIGLLGSLAAHRAHGHMRRVLELLMMLPLVVPTLLLGIGIYLLGTVLKIGNGFLMLTLGHTLIAIPYVVRIVQSGMQTIDPALEEAARSLGCSGMQAFFFAILPQLRTSLVCGFIFGFIESFGDVNLAMFIAGPGNTTIPVQIFSDILWQSDPTIAAASSLQMVIVCLLVACAFRLVGKRVSA